MQNLTKVILLPLLLISIACTYLSKQNSSNENIKAFKASQTFPILSKTGKLTGYDTMFIKVYFLNDMNLFELYFNHITTSSEGKENFEKRKHYFVFRKNLLYGIDYNQHSSTEGRKVLVDSLFRYEWIAVNNIYGIFNYCIPVLHSKKRFENNDSLTVSYSLRDKSDTNKVYANCYLGFNEKYKAFDVSISKQLDSMHNLKLCYARFQYFKTMWEGRGITSDEYESSFSLEEVPVDNKAEILSYFTRFEKDEIKLLK